MFAIIPGYHTKAQITQSKKKEEKHHTKRFLYAKSAMRKGLLKETFVSKGV